MGEPFFVRPDDFEVGPGIAEGVESFDIVEPELDDAVGLPEHRPLGPVAGDVALDVAAHIAFDVQLAGEERPVDAAPVLYVLFMGHVGAATAQDVDFRR